MIPNAPINRMEWVIKTYFDKYPWQVFGTAEVAASLFGVDSAPRDATDLWSLRQDDWQVEVIRDRVANLVLTEPEEGQPDRLAYQQRLAAKGFYGPGVKFDPAGQFGEVDFDLDRAGWAKLALTDWFLINMPRTHEYDHLIPWIARELVALEKDTLRAERDAKDSNESWQARHAAEEVSKALLRKISAIAMWSEQTGKNIMEVKLEDALDATENFEIEEDVPQGTIIHTFDDGWTAQELRTHAQLSAEGEVMQHCVGNYCDWVQWNKAYIISIRDRNGKPHATIEWSPPEGSGDGLSQEWGVQYPGRDWIAVRNQGLSAILEASRSDGWAHPSHGWVSSKSLRLESISAEGKVSGKRALALYCRRFLLEGFTLQVFGKQNDAVVEKYRPYVWKLMDAIFFGDAMGKVLSFAPAGSYSFRGRTISAEDPIEFNEMYPSGVFRNVDFSGSKLRRMKFAGQDMSGCNFDECGISDVTFDTCDMKGASFRQSVLNGGSFFGCSHLDTVSFDGAKVFIDHIIISDRDGNLHEYPNLSPAGDVGREVLVSLWRELSGNQDAFERATGYKAATGRWPWGAFFEKVGDTDLTSGGASE